MTECNRRFMVAFFVLTPAVASGQGTPGQITKFGADGTTSVDSVASEDATGNIGIGTTTPQARLDVNGAVAGTQYNIGSAMVLSMPGTNSFVGVHAGQSSTTGYYNSFFGMNAGQSSTTGIWNSFFGAFAGERNRTGGFNSFFGTYAGGANATGQGNSFFGAGSGAVNTFGNSNSFFGSNAGSFNEGNFNSFFGSGAGSCNTTGENNSFFGISAGGSNLHGNGNSFFGRQAGFWNENGSNNSFFGNNAGRIAGGSGNRFVGAGSDGATGLISNATGIGANAVVDASNKIRLGDTNVTVIEGQVGFTASSDRNKKENFQPVEGEAVLAKLRDLSLTSWNFIGHDPKQFRHYGPMAQDFFAAFGHDGIGIIGSETTITSTDMDGILMIAAQALERRAVEQKNRIDALTAENADLKARLDALERRIGSYALTKPEQ